MNHSIKEWEIDSSIVFKSEEKFSTDIGRIYFLYILSNRTNWADGEDKNDTWGVGSPSLQLIYVDEFFRFG
jgi:hypothetical protein